MKIPSNNLNLLFCPYRQSSIALITCWAWRPWTTTPKYDILCGRPWMKKLIYQIATSTPTPRIWPQIPLPRMAVFGPLITSFTTGNSNELSFSLVVLWVLSRVASPGTTTFPKKKKLTLRIKMSDTLLSFFQSKPTKRRKKNDCKKYDLLIYSLFSLPPISENCLKY